MENERNNKPVPAQWLHMLNSSHIQRKLEQGPKLKAIFESGRKPEEIVEELYLTILSRLPTPDEVKTPWSTAGPCSQQAAGRQKRVGQAGCGEQAGCGQARQAVRTSRRADKPVRASPARDKPAVAAKP